MDILTDSHPVARLDVVDTGRRGRWSEEAKLRIVEESFAGSRQASATARRHGISRRQIFSWRKAYREGRLGGAGGSAPVGARAMKKQAAPGGSAPAGFAPALVVPDAGSDGGRAGRGGGRLEIVSANGRRVIVDGDVDVGLLLRIVQGLEGLR